MANANDLVAVDAAIEGNLPDHAAVVCDGNDRSGPNDESNGEQSGNIEHIY